MRNATSIWLFGASSLVLSVIACGGGGGGSRDDNNAGTTSMTAGTNSTTAGTNSTTGGSSPGGSSSGGSGGGAATCDAKAGSAKGDGTDLVIDSIDDTDTMFTPAGKGTGSWDFSKDTAKPGTITPDGTTALMPEAGGQAGSALHVQGAGLLGWGASLAAFLNGPTGAFDASAYDGVAFYLKGTSTVQEGANKVMIQARMPDVLPGPGSCCDASATPVAGKECYSGHRVVIDIPADWTEVKIAWTDFKGPAWGLGSTMALDPNRIRDINFSFNHDSMMMTGDGTSFDVWVDGLRFLSKGEMGNVKPGGSGGSGGSGGGTGGSGGSGGTGGSDADGGADQ